MTTPPNDRRTGSHEIGTNPSSITLALNVDDAAAAIGISPRKLWELTNDGVSGVPVCRLGTRVLYPVAALERWLADRAEAGGAP